ncbi:MAG: adenylosuccinate synthetase, partial [Chlamydiia bacterium]|nr:adenylosuccinate synthetase [Chlamydiia bacterium]
MHPLEVDIVIGALWGDEGKGKYVAQVCKRYDAVLRVNASTNAGHCVEEDGAQYVTRQLPSYFFPGETELVVAPGALLNLVKLKEEIEERPDIEQLRGKLKVANSISLVLDPYVLKCQGKQSQMIGSTHQGTGPSAAARTARHSLRLYDIEAALRGDASVVDKIAHTTRETIPHRFDEDSAENRSYFKRVLDENVQAYRSIVALIGPFTVDYSHYLGSSLRAHAKRVLIEGCNGLLLDNLHGALPYTTSASTNLGAMVCGANLSPQEVQSSIVVTSAYATCLGKRPFPTEMS